MRDKEIQIKDNIKIITFDTSEAYVMEIQKEDETTEEYEVFRCSSIEGIKEELFLLHSLQHLNKIIHNSVMWKLLEIVEDLIVEDFKSYHNADHEAFE